MKGALVVREVWTRIPRQPDSILINEPRPRAAEQWRRERGHERGQASTGIDLGNVLLSLGRRDAGLPRHIDIDGDGEVTLLDLEMALRIKRMTGR